jgi:hypothetical protein
LDIVGGFRGGKYIRELTQIFIALDFFQDITLKRQE